MKRALTFFKTRRKDYLLILSFLLALTGCEKTPQISPLAQDAVILAFGDSLTFGTGASREASYPAVLSKSIGRKVVNAGIPGETSEEGLRRLPSLIAEHSPDLVILCHGGNDFLRHLDPGAMRANVAAMVRLCREGGADVILLGVPELSLFLDPSREYDVIAKEMLLPYDRETIAGILGKRKLKSDRIHPNGKGYEKLAEAVASLIRKAGGL